MLGRFTTRRPAAPPPAPDAELPAAAVVEVAAPPIVPQSVADDQAKATLLSEKLLDAKVRLHRRLIEEVNLSVLEKMSDDEVHRQIHGLVQQYTLAERLALNARELDDFVAEVLDEMTG